MHIDGILVTVVAKGESPRAEQPEQSHKVSKSNVDASKPMVALTFDDGPGNMKIVFWPPSKSMAEKEPSSS